MHEKGQCQQLMLFVWNFFSSQKGESAKRNKFIPSTGSKFPSLHVQGFDADLVFLNRHNRKAGEFWSGWTWFPEKSFEKYSHLYQNLKQSRKVLLSLSTCNLGKSWFNSCRFYEFLSHLVSVIFIGQPLKLLNLDDTEVPKIPKIKCVISTS